MSWMDWGAKPKKSSATPPPFYLTTGSEDTPYCHACGRVMGTRNKAPPKDKDGKGTASKFCSAKCRAHKPSTAADSIDRRIEDTFLALLNGEDPPKAPDSKEAQGSDESEMTSSKGQDSHSPAKKQPVGKKGDHRILVSCTQVEEIIYNRVKDPEKVYGRRKNRLPRWMPEAEGEWKSVDMVSSDEDSDAFTNDEDSSDGGVGLSDNKSNDSSTLNVENLSLYDKEQADPDATIEGADSPKAPPKKVSFAPSHDTVASNAIAVPSSDQTRLPTSSNQEIGNAAQSSTTHVSEDDLKRREGERKAQERERVRCAARRAVIFGLVTGVAETNDKGGSGGGKAKKGKKGKRRGSISSDDEEADRGPKEVRRKCEAVMQGVVVEPSFAKGDWGIRWREE